MSTRGTFRGLVVLFMTALTAMGTSLPSQAATILIDQDDERGDVTINNRVPGLTVRQRRSIDIHHVTVTELDRAVRFSITIKKITTSKRFDQALYFGFKPRTGDYPYGSIGVSPQSPRSAYASVVRKHDAENCHRLAVKVLRDEALVSVKVPVRCLPAGEVHVTAYSHTGELEGDGRLWSKDRLRVQGLTVLR